MGSPGPTGLTGPQLKATERGGSGEESTEVSASSLHNSSLMPSTQGVSMACFKKGFPYILL